MFIRLWNRLTEPAASITQRDQKRQARFLASLLLFLLLFGLFFEFVFDPLFSPDPPAKSLVNGKTVTFTLVIAAYILSRTRHYTATAIVLVSFFSLGVFASLYNLDGGVNSTLAYYLIVPIILSSLFLRLPLVTSVIVANFLGMWVVSLGTPTISFFDFPLIFLGLISGLLLFRVHYRDLLERDRQAVLVESEERYRTLFETVFEGIVILEQGQIVQSNAGFLRIFGCAPLDIYHRPIEEFIPDTLQIWERANSGHTGPMEIDGWNKDQMPLHLEVLAKTYLHQGRPSQMLAVRDLTEYKHTSEALQQAQRLDSLGLLAGGISHDFNNMLMGINTQVELALRKLPAESPALAHLLKTTPIIQSASNLIRQLMTYAGKSMRYIQILDLNQLVRETTTLVESALPQQVPISLAIHAHDLPIKADQSQVQQIIMNLLMNAAEASLDHDGDITITTQCISLSESATPMNLVGQEALSPGNYAVLSVRDTGAGMNEQTRQHIFDPLFTTKATGHGLGLSATLGVVRAHDGGLIVTSQEGHGSTFTVFLPLLEQETMPQDSNDEKGLETLWRWPPEKTSSRQEQDEEEHAVISMAELF